jgi:hypothetical protein
MKPNEIMISDVDGVIAPFGYSIISMKRISGGGNGRIYQLFCDQDQQFVAKYYFHHATDSRDRIGVEFNGLDFLWNHGLRNIPQPILMNRQEKCAIYEFVEGVKLDPLEVVLKDVKAIVDFLSVLKRVASTLKHGDLQLSSEACFHPQSIVDIVQERITRLQSVEESYPELKLFLNEHCIPLLQKIIQWSQAHCSRFQISWDQEIYRTLSPSDFGFHNALKRSNSEIVFLDLEYFGWDDPAKIICDFLFHPATSVSHQLKQYFVSKMCEIFSDYSQLEKKIEMIYPLIGLNWCLRLLNEFLSEHLLRRTFASVTDTDHEQVRSQQLIKAEQLLERIVSEYEYFPYKI